MNDKQIKAIVREYAKALEESGDFNPTKMHTTVI